jgi:2-phosphosulfolactate phosphatase
VPDISITLTPDELDKIPCRGQIVVAIDTLRASTSIVTALANGASSVMPFNSRFHLERYYLSKAGSNYYLLAGEKGGKAISGFDLGNSPLSFQPGIVKNKVILLKTNNGTRILKKISPENRIFIGALINSIGVIRRLLDLNRDVYLSCAGTEDAFSLEDFFTAGRYSYLLLKEGWSGDDLVTAAARIYEDNRDYDDIVNLFLQSQNGQNLLKLGFSKDIEFAARIDKFSIAPYLNGDNIII